MIKPKTPLKWSLIAFTLSLCSYLYELLLIGFASELSNNNFLIINLNLGTFILGLGLGLKDLPEHLTREESLTRLSIVEKNLCFWAIIAWVLIQGADFLQQHFSGLILTDQISSPLFKVLVEKYYFYILLASVISSILIGYNSGQELPLILNIASPNNEFTAHFFALTYLGSVAAAFSLNYIFKPILATPSILLLSILLNLSVYIIISKKTLKFYLTTLSILGTLTLSLIISPKIEQINLKNYYYHFSSLDIKLDDLPDIFNKETAYQKINIHTFKNREILSLNRQFQFSFNNEEVYHEALVHIPISLYKINPSKVLLLGAGDGLALRELLKYPDISLIKHIELDEEFTDFCRTNPSIAKLNNYSLDPNPRVIRSYGDAFYLVKQEKELYDLIIIDFPYPFTSDIWKLFSLEFYLSLQKRLSPKGIVVLDAPVQNKNIARITNNATASTLNSVLYSTIKAANFGFIRFFSFQKEGFIVASNWSLPSEKTNFDDSKLSPVTIKKLPNLSKEIFDYRNDPELVNSIFRPKFLDLKKDF